MPLTPSQVDDLVRTTLPQLGEFKWTDISYDLQEHIAWSRLLRRDRVTFQGGESIDLLAKVNQGTQARWTGLFEDDDIQIQNLMDKGNIPWKFADTHFAYDVRESVFNRGKPQILDYLMVRRKDAMVSLAGLMEAAFWGAPSGPTDRKFFGLAYWLVRNSTEGFNGGNPSGFSDCGGLNATTYTRWRNWTFQYSNISKTDLIRKLRKAVVKTNFVNPVSHPKYEGMKRRWSHYVNYNVLGAIEEYLEDNNENIGMDFGKYDGRAMFRGNPIEYVPYLENDSTNPWIGVDWATFSPVFQSGQWLRYSDPKDTSTTSHNTRAVFIDCILNLRCVNRRRNFIGYV